MFTGIVAGVGVVEEVTSVELGKRIGVDFRGFPSPRIGGSVALDGCCLTLEKAEGDTAFFFLSSTTLKKTTWGNKDLVGRRVNLEAPLEMGQPLGGHWVLGHVDGVADVLSLVATEGGGALLTLALPPTLIPFAPPRGSIAVNGISLTVASAQDGVIDVALIPETLERTAIQSSVMGSKVNLEVDVLARYGRGEW